MEIVFFYDLNRYCNKNNCSLISYEYRDNGESRVVLRGRVGEISRLFSLTVNDFYRFNKNYD